MLSKRRAPLIDSSIAQQSGVRALCALVLLVLGCAINTPSANAQASATITNDGPCTLALNATTCNVNVSWTASGFPAGSSICIFLTNPTQPWGCVPSGSFSWPVSTAGMTFKVVMNNPVAWNDPRWAAGQWDALVASGQTLATTTAHAVGVAGTMSNNGPCQLAIGQTTCNVTVTWSSTNIPANSSICVFLTNPLQPWGCVPSGSLSWPVPTSGQGFELVANIPPAWNDPRWAAAQWSSLVGSGQILATTTAFATGGGTPHQAQFIAPVTVPTTMTAGQTYNVSVTMKNTGTDTWISTGTNPYRLGSQNPQGNLTWGLSRVNLPASVAPGQQVTFSFTVTAPTTPGTYNFQWQMLQEGVVWFGDLTPNVAVTVTQPTPTCNIFTSNDFAICSNALQNGTVSNVKINGSVTCPVNGCALNVANITNRPINIYGDPGVSKILRQVPDGGTAPTTPLITVSGSSNVTIHDLYIQDGAPTTYDWNYCDCVAVNVTVSTNVVLNNVTIENSKLFGVVVTASSVTVQNSRVSNSQAYGVAVNSSYKPLLSTLTIINSTFTNNWDAAVGLNGTNSSMTGSTLTNNHSHVRFGYGGGQLFVPPGASNISITSNTIQNGGTAPALGIEIASGGVTNVTIKKNYILNNGGYAVVINSDPPIGAATQGVAVYKNQISCNGFAVGVPNCAPWQAQVIVNSPNGSAYSNCTDTSCTNSK